MLIERDLEGVAHMVALSGGGDSTCLSVLLHEREPRPYNYLCTPTGDELPEMFAHFQRLSGILGRRILPIMEGRSLFTAIRDEGMIPNFQARWCTRKLKIEPFVRFLREQLKDGPVVAYVGLRADEPFRPGGSYGAIDGIELRYPLRDWGMDEAAVDGLLEQRGIAIPERTDCGRCYHQQIGEWWKLWYEFPDLFDEAIQLEAEIGGTFRTPKLHEDGSPVMVIRYGFTYAASHRDTWPCRLEDMKKVFAAGHVPTVRNDPRVRDMFRTGACAACIK